tara:strand:- start:302 stop:970 length:669 start_codon:yes stop_codon:yes gene_type:complete
MKYKVYTIVFASLVTSCGVKHNVTTKSDPTDENSVEAHAVTKPENQQKHNNTPTPSPDTTNKSKAIIKPQPQFEPVTESQTSKKIVKTDAEWKAILTPAEYQILRRKGTERAFTGKFDKHYKEGTYTCKGCGTPLFDSTTKYDSGCGWPAFFKAKENTIAETIDRSYGMIRTEITCKKCDGHLGHIFDDGPNPTGVRYCVNSASMGFIPADKDKQAKPAKKK